MMSSPVWPHRKQSGQWHYEFLFWPPKEINETHKGVNKPMVSNVKPLRHCSLYVVIAYDGTDHRYVCNNVNTFTCFITFPEIPWIARTVARTKTCNVVTQTIFCVRLWCARSRSDQKTVWPRETRWCPQWHHNIKMATILWGLCTDSQWSM